MVFPDDPSGTAIVAGSRQVPGRMAVFNFTVEDSHTYFVGDGEVVVHNSCAVGEAAEYDRGTYISSSYRTNGAQEIAPGAMCQYCQRNPATTIDHVFSDRAARDVAAMGLMPVSDIRVGLAGSDNLLGACPACNFGKGPMLPGNVAGTWLPSNPSLRAINAMQQLGTWMTP